MYAYIYLYVNMNMVVLVVEISKVILKEIFIREIYYRLIIIYSYRFVQEYSLSFEFCYSFLWVVSTAFGTEQVSKKILLTIDQGIIYLWWKLHRIWYFLLHVIYILSCQWFWFHFNDACWKRNSFEKAMLVVIYANIFYHSFIPTIHENFKSVFLLI